MSFPQFKEGPWSRKPRDISRVTTLYSVDPVLDRNHDAVIRIEGLAPEWWAILLTGIYAMVCYRVATTPDLHGRIRGHPNPTDELWSSVFKIRLQGSD